MTVKENILEETSVEKKKRDGHRVCGFGIHSHSVSHFSLLRQILNSDKQLFIREREFTFVDILHAQTNNQ
jgi:hypothetical protein